MLGALLRLCHTLPRFFPVAHITFFAWNSLVLHCVEMPIQNNSSIPSVKSSLIPIPTDPNPLL